MRDQERTDRMKPLPDLASLKIDQSDREQAGMSRGMIAIIILIIGAAVFGTAFVVMRDKPVSVTVLTVAARSSNQATAVLNASGYVTPRRRATIAAKITGRVKDMLVDEGMIVEAGQTLALLDDTDARAALRTTQADLTVSQAAVRELNVALKNAEKNRDRIRELKEQTFASQQQLDDAVTAVDSLQAQISTTERQVEAAQARENQTRRDLENYVITAPFAGVVVSKDAQIGEIVSPVSAGGGYTRTGIATIVDMQSLEIEVDVNESYISRVSPGQNVEAKLDAYPDWSIPAHVRTVIPTADRQKATVKVRITFQALDPRLLPDMGIKVTFLADETTPGSERAVILIPRSAVRSEGEKNVVFIVTMAKIEARSISVGELQGNNIEVMSGLSPGEQIVSEVTNELRDGATVVIAT